MVNPLSREEWHSKSFTTGGLNVLDEGGGNKVLVVFIHGLGGHGYESWGDTPLLLHESATAPGLDVGAFDYRSRGASWRGLRKGSSPYDFRVNQLADQLRNLEGRYEHVFLVGHSQGGLLARDVAHKRLERSQAYKRDTDLAGLVMVASPRAGSRWVLIPGLRRLLATDYEVLRPDSAARARTDTYFNTYVEIRNVAQAAANQVVLPMYAVIGAADRLVSTFSAEHGIPADQLLHLDTGHLRIAKSQEDHELADWLLKRVEERLDVRAQAARQAAHQKTLPPFNALTRPTLVTEFLGDPENLRWHELYNDARRELTTEEIVIQDREDAPGSRVHLRIHVQGALRVIAAGPWSRQALAAAYARGPEGDPAIVGISPVGAQHLEAKQVVLDWLEEMPPRPGIAVSSAADARELRSVMTRWLLLVINRDARRPALGADHGTKSDYGSSGSDYGW